MTIDYSMFYKRSVDPERLATQIGQFDVLVSAFTRNERVQRVFTEVRASRKIWLVHPEYGFTDLEAPAGEDTVRPAGVDEIEQVEALLDAIGDLTGMSVCIDTTGFMRSVLVFLVAKLQFLGVTDFTALYSEPSAYLKQDQTQFTTATSGVVRPVAGMSLSNHTGGKDHLVIAVGYDDAAVGEVANNKDAATVHPIFGFPSLSPDMYQQSAIRSSRSSDKAFEDEWVTNRRFAPASDPFATAGVVSGMVKDIDRASVSANIYLAPLSTKAQALGFAVYWCLEGRRRGAISLILPECVSYSRDTSIGLKRVWKFSVELY